MPTTINTENSNPVVERGAAAMQAKRRELIAQPLDRIWPDLMRAAMEAMREPTEAMLAASEESAFETDAKRWRAMIDAALKVQP